MAKADFNDDTEVDLVTANGLRSDVSVLLGNGNGRFQNPVYFATGDSPVSVAVADFDGDSAPDIVTANHNSDGVSVLLGNGDGTFQESTSFKAGNGPAFVAAADLDGDDVPDIITANDLGDDLSVLLGNGDGTFQDFASFAAGDGPVFVAVANLDGDGFPDLVTANRDGSNLSVLRGNGDGSFQSPAFLTAGDVPVAVAVADLDGDDFLDLATANRDSNDVSVLLGNGDGTFQAATFFYAGIAPVSIAVDTFYSEIIVDPGDPKATPPIPPIIHPDEFPDLVTANRGSNNVGVLLGNGDGSFRAALYFATGNAPVAVATENVNGDTRTINNSRDGSSFVVPLPDIITANRDSYGVSVLLGRRLPPETQPVVSFAAPLASTAVIDRITVVRPKQFCNAVDKNGEGLVNPEAHLTCFETRPSSSVRSQVVTTDQFGELELDVRKRRTEICAPAQLLYAEEAATAAPPPRLEFYEMYSVGPTRGAEKFQKREVSLVDQFLDEIVELKKPARLGVPTERNSVDLVNSFHHLNCYKLKAPKFKKRDIQMSSAFGTYDLTLRKPSMLCTPSAKEVVSEAP